MLLIDAYNLYKREGGDEATSNELERWIRRLAGNLGPKRRSAILVFDAFNRPGGVCRKSVDRLEVIFTPFGQTADSFILEFLLAVRARDWTVITSDIALAEQARSLGAANLSVEEFMSNSITRRKSMQNLHLDRGHALRSPRESARFCKAFERRLAAEGGARRAQR